MKGQVGRILDVASTSAEPPAEVITGLRFGGTAHPVVALPARRVFTIGAGACDVRVPGELAVGVAPVHATMERSEGALRVRARGRDGLYRRPRSRRVGELLLEPGAMGWIGGCAIVPMTRELERLRERLRWCLGLDAHGAIDEGLAAIVEGGPLVLVGPRTLDGAGLARAIHGAGPDAAGALVVSADEEVPALDGATGTRVIDLDRVRRFPAAQVAAMFAPRCGARVILLAHDERVVRRHLDTYAERARSIALVPLGQRSHEVTRLLQAIWRDELGTTRAVTALGARALDGLAAHGWRGNLDELRATAARLLACVEQPTLRRAAEVLGIRRQTLAQHLDRVGVAHLPRAERDDW